MRLFRQHHTSAPSYPPEHSKVTVKNLTVEFPSAGGNIVAVHDAHLSIEKGEFVCVVGPSGCGKTTLLRVLAQLEQPTVGEAQIFRESAERPAYGMVFQNAGLFPWMSVLENINYGMRMHGVGGRRRYQTAQRWMEQVGLSRFADTFPEKLSGGMQQRVGLARAFAYNPEVLLLDEPFGALDAQTRLVLQQTLLELWKESDMTVVFVTHSIEEALLLSDRIVVMSARPGHILQSFDVNFDRPRDVMELRSDPSFGNQYNVIWSILREQVNLSMREQQ